MITNNKYKILFVFLIIAQIACGQNVLFEKDNFPNDKEGYKNAAKNISEGDYLLKQNNYTEAVEYYLRANGFNDKNAELNYKIGLCYLNNIERFACLPYFEKAYSLNENVVRDIHLLLGRGYHLNGNFDKAITEYKAHLTSGNPYDGQEENVKKYIKECENGKVLINKDSRAFVDNLGKVINSAYDDHSPLISADASTLIFTSSRENGKKPDITGRYDEDIYISTRTGKEWSESKSIGEPVNSQYNDATVGLSPDGQILIVYDGRKDGNLQYCWLDGYQWSYPKNLPKVINSDYSETSACYSPDGNQLYFVSEKPGGKGGRDIWISKKDSKDKWSEATNLGSTINTPYDEETVFIHPDGRTLYFSSKGHNSMGGFDIFVTHRDEAGIWSDPENLGSPINSPDDDLCFVISANGRFGYCSSARPEGLGGFDIYKMTFLGPEKPLMVSTEDNLISVQEKPVTQMVMEESVEIKTIRLTIVKGTVKDAFTQKPVSASIDIIDNEKNEVIFTSKTNSASGKFLVSLPSGKNYGLVVKAEEYLFHSENFDIPAATEYQEVEKEIDLASVKKDVKIILKNVFFETGSAKLRPTSYAELGRLTKMLSDYPNLKIEISGHTDNVGAAATNQRLSEDRAKSVVDFLAAEGVDASRLSYKGYGLEQPIADNSSKEGRAHNRRVEFKVISN